MIMNLISSAIIPVSLAIIVVNALVCLDQAPSTHSSYYHHHHCVMAIIVVTLRWSGWTSPPPLTLLHLVVITTVPVSLTLAILTRRAALAGPGPLILALLITIPQDESYYHHANSCALLSLL